MPEPNRVVHPLSHRLNLRATAVVLAALTALPACSGERRRDRRASAKPPAPYQAEVDEGVGAAVVILVDTSGSMKETAPGDRRPKHVVAREAIAKMLSATDAFQRKRPDFAIKVGIMRFANDTSVVLPIQAHDRQQELDALGRIPAPSGGTAIGTAMRRARPHLYRAGVFRKYIVVVTDGENTSGPDPAAIAREIHDRSEGAVVMYFVAFDTKPEKFAFLEEVGGTVVAAQNAAELDAALDDIYAGKILAEAIDYGETEPSNPSQTGR